MAAEIYTIGHSTHDGDQFLALLQRHGIRAVADVRRYPGSRRNPQFNAEQLASSLGSAGIELVAFGETLGGRRRAEPGSANGGWRVEGFRGYADHMESEQFAAAMRELEALGRRAASAVMCAEADWRRCHRRLISDALVTRGWRVLHVGPGGEAEEHTLTPFAVVEGERISYPPAQQELS
jgi:uncharacterized protein (DUF488 family)